MREPLFVYSRIRLIQPGEEIVVTASVDFPQFDDDTGSNIQFTRFIFGVGGSSDVTTPALSFGTELFLRDPMLVTQFAEIVAHTAVTSDFLLQVITPGNLLTSIGCNYRYFMEW